MKKKFRSTLAVKLFLSYLVILLIGGAVLALVVELVIPAAYERHVIGPQRGIGSSITRPRDMILEQFRSGVNEALLISAGIALLAAILVSLLISRRIILPLRDITQASLRISAGQYNQRVNTQGLSAGQDDELAQLAQAFNQMAEKLENTERMRSQLIGDVSHELLTPLTAIKGSMEALVDGILPATPETFEQVEQEADRLQRLARDLQELSRVEAGAYKLEMQPIQLFELLQTAIERVQTQFMLKEVQLISQFSSELPSVQADPDRLLQVLINLLSNAYQYTPAGGQVVLKAAPQSSEVFISVKDNGMGIPAEHLPHLFTRFYRVDKSRSRQSGGGSGIGLAITRHLVEAHGGTIWAESAGIGQGSTFSFTLPILKHP